MYRTRSRVGTKNVTRTGECSVNIDKFYAVQDAACSRSEMPLFSKTRSKCACNRANRGKSRKKRSFRYKTQEFQGDFSWKLTDELVREPIFSGAKKEYWMKRNRLRVTMKTLKNIRKRCYVRISRTKFEKAKISFRVENEEFAEDSRL